jgi:hypothetical protein
MRYAGFIGPSYTLESVNVDCQRCVNLYPEMNQLGTGKEREVAFLAPTPGLRLLLTLGATPVRGIWYASNGQLFAVGGNKLYRISSAWSATELGSLNTSSGPVSIADNGLHVVVVDGTNGYTWTIASSTFATISDPDFFTADQVTFQDGYFIANKQGSQQFFISGLYDITWDALDIASVEGSPDDLIGLISMNQNLHLFGSQSVEVFYNSGDADFPFTRIQGAVVDVGCAAAFSIAKLDNSIYWIGGDDSGTGIVYRMKGYNAERVSNAAVESVIRSVDPDDLADARAWAYQQSGHLFYCLNLPGIDSTWVFDASTSLWHERTYHDLFGDIRHRADCHAAAFGENVVGDFENGNIYALDKSKYTDDGTPIVRIRAAPHISNGLRNLFHSSFQLDMETGVGVETAASPATKASVTFTLNGANYTFTAVDPGVVGNTYTVEILFDALATSVEVAVSGGVNVQIVVNGVVTIQEVIDAVAAHPTASQLVIGSSTDPTDVAEYLGSIAFPLTGGAEESGTYARDPQAVLQWSDDGGHTWSNERFASIGKIGEKKKRGPIWRRLGCARDRVYRVKISDPVKVVMIGAEIEYQEGAA